MSKGYKKASYYAAAKTRAAQQQRKEHKAMVETMRAEIRAKDSVHAKWIEIIKEDK